MITAFFFLLFSVSASRHVDLGQLAGLAGPLCVPRYATICF